jgi:hypothetical protein
MRLWQWLVTVLVVGTCLGIAREEVGRVALIVFITGLGEVVLGTSALLALFQSVGAIGQASGPGEYAGAVAQTALVLLVATSAMMGVLWLGVTILMAAVA